MLIKFGRRRDRKDGGSERITGKQAQFIRALYDAAEKVVSDQQASRQDTDVARENSEKLAALLAEGRSVGDAAFADAAQEAVSYMMKQPLNKNDEPSSED